jgi:predicted ATPase
VRSGRLTGFVGREHELGLLIERWSLAQDGEGQVVLLSGEPGTGKSLILSELRSRLEAEHAASLRLQCSPYRVNSAFYPIIDRSMISATRRMINRPFPTCFPTTVPVSTAGARHARRSAFCSSGLRD